MVITWEEFETLGNTTAGNLKDEPEWGFWQWCMQDKNEFWPMLEEVSKLEPKNILEIGSSHGGCLIFYDEILDAGGKLISIDCNGNPDHQWTMDYSRCTSDMTFISKSSHDAETLSLVESALGGQLLDFLFIDGDHSEAGARQDYEMYSHLVREGGIVGFHDISYDSEIQVGRFFNTIDKPKRKIEFSHGIGLVYF